MDYDIPETSEPTKLIESKKYEINYEEDSYSLLIETYSNETIFFQLRKANNLSLKIRSLRPTIFGNESVKSVKSVIKTMIDNV